VAGVTERTRPSVRFDVNDAALREAFLRARLVDALAPLETGHPALWGGMTAQQMVEHLEWAFRTSTGEERVECPVPEEERRRVTPFLYSNMPTPRGFENPVLVNGLPAFRHPSLAEAKAALERAVARFSEHAAGRPDDVHVHPLFGPLDAEQWSRAHFKHCVHHLLQFGLLDVDGAPAGP
jgi:oxepin-CoA hydrolase/3-oxo-5,6-dehydrosuberyl-CoA semialdehyde dehydrogenase